MQIERRQGEIAVISASGAGTIGGCALVFGVVANLGTLIGRDLSRSSTVLVLLTSIALTIVAMIAFVAPWERLGPRSTLALLPAVLGLQAFSNYSDPDPYIAGIFFVVIGAWIGLCHPRFTTLALSPVIALTYWAPLAVNPHLPTLAVSTAVITSIAVAIGELLGHVGERLEQAQRELIAEAERRFATLVEHSADVTMVFGGNGKIAYVSPAAEKVLGRSASSLESMPVEDFISNYVRGLKSDLLTSLLDGTLSESDPTPTSIDFKHGDGTWLAVEAIAYNRLDDPDINGFVIHARDVRRQRALEKDLEFRAFHDDLTGLMNRYAFIEAIRDAANSKTESSVVLLDIDDFKSVNTFSGPKYGDLLLRMIARRLELSAPHDSVIARTGGDEFAILLWGRSEDVVEAVEKLIDEISKPFALAGESFSITACAGIASTLSDSVSVELPARSVIGDADTAMHAAKADPTNRVARFEAEMRSTLIEKADTRVGLRRALDNNELVLHYQPILDLKSQEWVGAESLVRWNHPTLGLVGPGDFIGEAEQSGLIVPMGKFILNESCREAASWHRRGLSGLSIAVNVSARQFQDADLLSDITSALESSGLSPQNLVIEITESVLMADIEAAEHRLKSLRDMGIRLALDDFGTGYSSLSYLQALPFDVLKIDRSFVVNATTQPSDLALLQTINRLGHDLGLRTLVEGIETEAQARLSASIRCDLAQGFHFARPVPSATLNDLWSSDVRATSHTESDALSAMEPVTLNGSSTIN